MMDNAGNVWEQAIVWRIGDEVDIAGAFARLERPAARVQNPTIACLLKRIADHFGHGVGVKPRHASKAEVDWGTTGIEKGGQRPREGGAVLPGFWKNVQEQ